MSDSTPIYGFQYFEPGQITGQDLDMDEQRFRAIENQLYNLYTIFGNGIVNRTDPITGNPISSWVLSIIPNSTSSISISAGQGHVSFKYAQTTAATTLLLTPPIGFTSGTVIYYIYAVANGTTSNLMTVDFIATFTLQSDTNNYIGLGGVVVTYGTPNTIQVYNTSSYGRKEISLFSQLSQLVLQHVHIGGSNNPSPIDLSKHVQGKLSGDNITDLDLSTVTQGVLDPDRLPTIDHNSLTRIGHLTHPQIDSLLSQIIYPSADYRLSDLSVINRLQVILGLKKQIGLFNIDSTQLASIFYVPYSQLDTFYDHTYTTAIVDTNAHVIIGAPGIGSQSSFVSYADASDFTIAQGIGTLVINPTPTNVIINNNQQLVLSQPLNYLSPLTPPDIPLSLENWKIYTQYDVTNTRVVGSTGIEVQESLRKYIYRIFDSTEDWSALDTAAVCFQLSGDDDFQFGVINLFVTSSVGFAETNLIDDSTNAIVNITRSNYVPVFNHQSPGVSQIGFSTVALVSFGNINLSSITGVGFMWDTATDWQNAVKSDFNLYPPSDSQVSGPSNIYSSVLTYRRANSLFDAIYAWNNNEFSPTGNFVFRFDSGPTNSAVFTQFIVDYNNFGGASLTAQTRVGNTTDQLNQTFSLQTYAPVSGANNAIVLPSNQPNNRFIDLILNFFSNPGLTTSPQVNSVFIYYTVSGINQGIIWDTNINNAPISTYPRFKWASGNLNNIKIAPAPLPNPNSNYYISINDTTVGSYQYLSSAALDQGSTTNNVILSQPIITGFQSQSIKYFTPYQVFSNPGQPVQGLSYPREYVVGPSNQYIIADTLNDRILTTDSVGNYLSVLQGNIRLARKQRDFVVTGAYYNPSTQYIFITFSQYISFATDGTAPNNLSLQVAGTVYLFTDSASFIAAGTWRPNGNGNSATMYAQVTSKLASIINNAPVGTVYLIIQNNASNPPILMAGFDNDPDNNIGVSTISCPPSELVVFQNIGQIQCSPGLPSPTSLIIDPTKYDNSVTGFSTFLLDYQYPYQKTLIQLPVYIGSVYFENIYAPISVQYTLQNSLIVTSAGSMAVRAFDSNYNSIWNLSNSIVAFSEFFGGNAYITDDAEDESQNLLMLSAPGLSNTTAQGTVSLYNRSTNTLVYNVVIPSGDPIKSIPTSNTSFYTLIYDRLSQGKQSKMVEYNTNGDIIWQYGLRTLIKPTGFRILDNNNIIISNCNGVVNNINFLAFTDDNGLTGGNILGAGNT